jgi:hypothetical protein
MSTRAAPEANQGVRSSFNKDFSIISSNPTSDLDSVGCHVFVSKKNSSWRTQCKATAHQVIDVFAPAVTHHQLRQAKCKKCKQQRLLSEVIVPSKQKRFTKQDVESKILALMEVTSILPPLLLSQGFIGVVQTSTNVMC